MSSDLRTHNACPTCPGAIRLLPSECLIPNTRELCIVHTFSLWRVIMWFGWSEIDVSFKLTAVVTWPRCNVAWLQVSVCVPVCYGLLGRTTLLCSQDWCVYLLQKIYFSHQFHVAMFSMYVNLFVAISVFFAFFSYMEKVLHLMYRFCFKLSKWNSLFYFSNSNLFNKWVWNNVWSMRL